MEAATTGHSSRAIRSLQNQVPIDRKARRGAVQGVSPRRGFWSAPGPRTVCRLPLSGSTPGAIPRAQRWWRLRVLSYGGGIQVGAVWAGRARRNRISPRGKARKCPLRQMPPPLRSTNSLHSQTCLLHGLSQRCSRRPVCSAPL